MAASSDVNYRIGSQSYDQDFDFVESYAHFVHSQASPEEIKSLLHGYVSDLYKYKSKLKTFLDNLSLDNYPKYKSIGEAKLREFSNRLYHQVSNEFDVRIKEIEKMESFTKLINIEIQKLFILIAGAFCLDINIVNKVKSGRICSFSNGLKMLIEGSSPSRSDDIRPIVFGSDYCYLANDIGFFGLNTWLYSYFKRVALIGIPSRYSDFDFRSGVCPGSFILHDYDHDESLDYVKLEEPALQASIYKQIIMDPEATVLQKELLTLALWMILHEAEEDTGAFPNLFHSDTHDSFGSLIDMTVDLYDEFNRFRELVLTQEFLDHYFKYLDNYKKSEEYIREDFFNLPRNIKDLTELLDRDEKILSSNLFFKPHNTGYGDPQRLKSKIMWSLIFLYFRDYCIKYYDLTIPKTTLEEIMN